MIKSKLERVTAPGTEAFGARQDSWRLIHATDRLSFIRRWRSIALQQPCRALGLSVMAPMGVQFLTVSPKPLDCLR